MSSAAQNLSIETRSEGSVRVVIDVPVEGDDMDDQAVLAKAWAILAERITLERREQTQDAVPAEEVSPAPPGNAAWWGG